jgi:hypothetical protein
MPVVDLSDEVIAAVEFMITVNCENVTKERISAPDKLNKKREAKAKSAILFILDSQYFQGSVCAPRAARRHPWQPALPFPPPALAPVPQRTMAVSNSPASLTAWPWATRPGASLKKIIRLKKP